MWTHADSFETFFSKYMPPNVSTDFMLLAKIAKLNPRLKSDLEDMFDRGINSLTM